VIRLALLTLGFIEIGRFACHVELGKEDERCFSTEDTWNAVYWVHFSFFPHRAAIAFFARAFRSAAVSAAAEAWPPFDPAMARNSILLAGTFLLGFAGVLIL